MTVPNERVSLPSEFPYSEQDYGRAQNLWSVPKAAEGTSLTGEVPVETLEQLAERYRQLQQSRADRQGILSESVELDVTEVSE